jgi:hypothetical protein
MTMRALRRRFRRFHGFLATLMLTLYVASGLLILAGIDSSRLRGLFDIAIGIAHGLF